MWVPSLGREDPLKEEIAAPSGILARKIPWTEKHGGLQSMGSQRVEHNTVHTRAHTHTHTGSRKCYKNEHNIRLFDLEFPELIKHKNFISYNTS